MADGAVMTVSGASYVCCLCVQPYTTAQVTTKEFVKNLCFCIFYFVHRFLCRPSDGLVFEGEVGRGVA